MRNSHYAQVCLPNACAPMACILQIDRKCHEVKKGKRICKHCRGNATPEQLELEKEHVAHMCKQQGCFDWCMDTSEYCHAHDQCRSGLSLMTKASIVKAERRKHTRSPRQRIRVARATLNDDETAEVKAKVDILNTTDTEILLHSVTSELKRRNIACARHM